MAKFHKLAGKLVDDLNKGKYLSAVMGLQHSEIVLTLHEILLKANEKISEDETEGLRDVLKASKSISELNEYTSGILYKLMPDNVYDKLIEKYKSLKDDEEPFPSFIPSGMRSVEQDFPELSGTLDKAYTVYDISDKPSVEKWIKKCLKELGVKKLKLFIAPKFDGTSVTITFEKQSISEYNRIIPIKALTRGDYDNNLGVDLSNILVGRQPLELDDGFYDHLRDKIGIQYEAMITEYGKENLAKIVKTNYTTRRAAIASALKRIANPKTDKNELKEINKCITLVPLMMDNKNINCFKEEVSFSNLIEFMHHEFYIEDSDHSLLYMLDSAEGSIDYLLENFEELVDRYVSNRSDINYSIDGLVLSIANHDHIETIGRSGNKNKWQIAYKFDAMVQRTKITGIISSMGKQGFIGHNITFDQIEFNGISYVKAPVNNVTRFDELDPHIGDEVLVSYNADVMGYIYKDKTCKPSKHGEPILLPELCIRCKSPLITTKDMLKCVNDNCSGHKVGRLLETIRILDFNYFGEETANDLVEKAGISNAIEFIQMKYEDLEKVLKGLNLKKAWEEFQNKIKAPISYAKVIDLLRIPNLRTTTAEKIVNHFGGKGLMDRLKNIENVNVLPESYPITDLDLFTSDLLQIKGIAQNAEKFAEGLYLKQYEFKKLTKLLNVVENSNDKEKVYDKTILISGFRSDSEFEEICKRLNFNIIDSGSKYDLLVVTPDKFDKTKAVKARKKGIPIMLLFEFIQNYQKAIDIKN